MSIHTEQKTVDDSPDTTFCRLALISKFLSNTQAHIPTLGPRRSAGRMSSSSVLHRHTLVRLAMGGELSAGMSLHDNDGSCSDYLHFHGGWRVASSLDLSTLRHVVSFIGIVATLEDRRNRPACEPSR